MSEFHLSGVLVAAEVEKDRGTFLVTLRVPMTADAEWVTCRQYSVAGPARRSTRIATTETESEAQP